MPISEADIQESLLELFAARGMAEGEVMWLSRLEQFWAVTGLRRTDLLGGIAGLCSQGLLDIEELDAQTSLSLTAAGQRRAAEVFGTGERYRGRYLQKELLPAVRRHDEPERKGGGGRRDYETSPPAGIPWSRH